LIFEHQKYRLPNEKLPLAYVLAQDVFSYLAATITPLKQVFRTGGKYGAISNLRVSAQIAFPTATSGVYRMLYGTRRWWFFWVFGARQEAAGEFG
jgi:hypothetical protein